MTPLADMIPTMTDADLTTLRANAARLVEHGASTQVMAASDILPVIDDELARRAALPKPAMDGNHLGQLVHQQVRACATRFNAYTRHNGTYTNADCQDRVETNMHVIAQCPRYAAARESFSRVTGVALCEATYTDVMAINYNKLRVDKMVLAKALCAFLAQVAKKHACHNKRDFASVATPLGCNQRRSIIQASRPEREPD